MKYLDFIAQTVILVVGLLSILVLATNGKMLAGLLYVELILGSWQYVSSLFSLFANGRAYDHKRRHFFMSTVYLLFFFGTLTAGFTVPEGVLISFATIIPCVLAIYYYVFTYKLVFNSYGDKSSFLRHLNF